MLPTLLKPGFMKGTEEVPIDAIVSICLKVKSEKNKVIVLKATTGSGKSTVMPQYLSKNFPGIILSLQPRVFNAIDLPKQIMKHDKSFELGRNIGYKTGNYQMEPQSGILFLTNGTFAGQLQNMTDDQICEYAVIIIDEAHELDLMALSIHFRMKRFVAESGYRSDSPVIIITSATFDHEYFAKYYDTKNIFEVDGYTYPIEEHFLPYDTQNYPIATAEIVNNIEKQGIPGDILIFVAGKQEMDMIRRELMKIAEPDSILELDRTVIEKGDIRYKKIFEKASDLGVKRKIIMATNVGETGITYPYLKIVIDTGFQKTKLYNCDFDIYTLKNQPVSWFSSQQRKGRVGRESPGSFYGVYSRDTYLKLSKEPDVKIYQENIAAIIPQYSSLEYLELWKAAFVKTSSEPLNITEKLEIVKKTVKNDFNNIYELIYKPSSFSIWRGLEKLYLLGFINSDLSINAIYSISEKINISLEAVKIIMAGYYWKAPIPDLILIALAVNENPLKYDKNTFNLETRCDFIPMVKDIYDFANGVKMTDKKINSFKNIFARRDELINALVSMGFNPYQDIEKCYPKHSDNYIKLMKQCIYEGLRLHVAIWLGEKYITSGGFEVYAKKTCNAFMYARIVNGKAEGMSVLDNFINYDTDFD